MPAAYNAPKSYPLVDWSFGWDIAMSPLNLDKRALADCKNYNLTRTRGLKKRGGMSKLYPTAAVTDTPITELYEYKAPNGTNYVLAAVSTKIMAYYSAAWNDLKTGLTAGKRYSFVTHQGFCYGVNGTDANFKLYNNTAAWAVGIPVPGSAPVVTDGGAGGLTGKYTYVYCYRRSTPNPQTGNPSAESTELDLTSKKFNVAYTASSDPQVDKIVIYRTLNLNDSGTDPTAYFKVTEVANATSSYDDETADADLGTALEIDNGAPPKAKFLVLHNDRVYYANCPDETDGGSLVKWSKTGRGEAVPSINYQYFDRKDGEDITGAASIGDKLVVFKRNRIFVMVGDPADITSIYFYKVSSDIGCVAPWAVLAFEDKVIFLSEKGWMSFDGENLYDLAKPIRPLAEDGFFTEGQGANYSAAYYPIKDQFIYNCPHSVKTDKMFAGHFLVPLLFVNKGIPEQESQNIVGWTYHEYPNHALKCISTYTDSDGITRILAGSSLGYVFLLDSGTSDDGSDIPHSILTGWQALTGNPAISTTVRLGFLSMAVDADCTLSFTVEKDYETPFFTGSISWTAMGSAYCGYCYCGYAYCGSREGYTERVKIPGSPGQLYRFGLSGEDQADIMIQAMTFMYRVQGVR